jgi:hypothetical protein
MGDLTRRDLLKAAGAAPLAVRAPAQERPRAFAVNGTILRHTSTTGVFVPPRGRGFQKFSFDFPEPSVAFDRYEFGFRVFTHENVYGMSPRLSARLLDDNSGGVDVSCSEFVWAGGQQAANGQLNARLRPNASGGVDCTVAATMDRPVKAIAVIVRGVPRGRLSAGGAPFFDPRDDEILFGYPFSGGDLFGPQGNGGLTTPLVVVQPDPASRGDAVVALSSLDGRVRTKRFYLQPGADDYRAELLVEAEGWRPENTMETGTWRIEGAASIGAAAESHYRHLEGAFAIPRWADRGDVPDWLRRVQLVVTLHGMHYTGFIFNDYARMRSILQWIATRMDPSRALVFLSSWDGRYYWDYPRYQPPDRMGGPAGLALLIKDAQSAGFRVMPMFGANTANRNRPEFSRIADAATAKIDGDRLDLNWVDWDNDRHQEGWLSYMNLGVDSWRSWLESRIADVIHRYDVDAYFLDIVGGWVNNPKADMHDGTRRLVENLRRRFPRVVAVGEMHYDAMMAFIPMYHSFGQTLITDVVQRHAKFFQHLSHPAPGRGSTGVHEAGFGRWNPQTLSLSDAAIPTLNVVDDTFDRYRNEMDAVIQKAKER